MTEPYNSYLYLKCVKLPNLPPAVHRKCFQSQTFTLLEFCKLHQHLNRLLSNFPNISEAVSLVAKFWTHAPFKVVLICIQRNKESHISQNSQNWTNLKVSVGIGRVKVIIKCRQDTQGKFEGKIEDNKKCYIKKQIYIRYIF